MEPDDHICHCYHVPLRKLVNFAKRKQPSRPSQMTECLGAGTGCGWCIPTLKRIAEDPEDPFLAELSPEDYINRRSEYIKTEQPRNRF